MDNRLQYTCDSCHTFIVPLNPRVRCLVCADYDLCAICALGERFTPGHTGDHSTQVFKYCGGNGQAPVPASSYTTTVPPATPYSLPQYTETSVPSETRQPDLSGPENPRPAANYPPPEGSRQPGQWEPWFHPDSSPTEAYTTLMNDIFSLLDPTNVGNLVPETFSRFLDDMGYLPHENSCTLRCAALDAACVPDCHLSLFREIRPAVDTRAVAGGNGRQGAQEHVRPLLDRPRPAETPTPTISREGRRPYACHYAQRVH